MNIKLLDPQLLTHNIYVYSHTYAVCSMCVNVSKWNI